MPRSAACIHPQVCGDIQNNTIGRLVEGIRPVADEPKMINFVGALSVRQSFLNFAIGIVTF